MTYLHNVLSQKYSELQETRTLFFAALANATETRSETSAALADMHTARAEASEQLRSFEDAMTRTVDLCRSLEEKQARFESELAQARNHLEAQRVAHEARLTVLESRLSELCLSSLALPSGSFSISNVQGDGLADGLGVGCLLPRCEQCQGR